MTVKTILLQYSGNVFLKLLSFAYSIQNQNKASLLLPQGNRRMTVMKHNFILVPQYFIL